MFKEDLENVRERTWNRVKQAEVNWGRTIALADECGHTTQHTSTTITLGDDALTSRRSRARLPITKNSRREEERKRGRKSSVRVVFFFLFSCVKEGGATYPLLLLRLILLLVREPERKRHRVVYAREEACSAEPGARYEV